MGTGRAARIDQDRAREEAALFERYLPIARALARRFARPGRSQDDLVPVAALGLLKAIDRFDPDGDLGFDACACAAMVEELTRDRREDADSVVAALELDTGVAIDRLRRSLGRPPSVLELAGALQADEEGVLDVLARVPRSA